MSVAISLPPIETKKPWGIYLRHECSRECRERAFWSHVDRSRGPDGCWLYRGSLVHGYGRFCHAGIDRAAHREALIISGKLKPRSRKLACHIVGCRNRHCVNPGHLYAGNHADNARDTVLSGTSNLGKRIPNGPVVEAKMDVSGKGEDWLSLRFRVPGTVLSECAGCGGLGFRSSEQKSGGLLGMFAKQYGANDYFVAECRSCGGTGLTPGSAIGRLVERSDRDDTDPLDALRADGDGWGSLFDEPEVEARP